MKKIRLFFKDKNKRYISLAILFTPIIIAMIVFGVKTFKDVREVMSLIKSDEDGSGLVVSNDHKIESMNYILRDNQTDYQFEVFTELKKAVEGGEATPSDIAGFVVKNFVVDFYTWSNKVAQYDVGGLYYVPKYSRENIYVNARDGFYKYLNEYIDKYGSENLLEVENVEILSVTKADNFDYKQIVKYYNEVDDDDYNEYIKEEIHTYEAYDVEAKWVYKQNDLFSTSNYPTTCKFKVVNNSENERYEIVIAGDVVDSKEVEK